MSLLLVALGTMAFTRLTLRELPAIDPPTSKSGLLSERPEMKALACARSSSCDANSSSVLKYWSLLLGASDRRCKSFFDRDFRFEMSFLWIVSFTALSSGSVPDL